MALLHVCGFCRVFIIMKPELSGLREQSQDACPTSRPGFGLLSDSTHKTSQLRSSGLGWTREVESRPHGTSRTGTESERRIRFDFPLGAGPACSRRLQ